MTKTELIETLAKKQRYLKLKDVDMAVGCIIESMRQTLIANDENPDIFRIGGAFLLINMWFGLAPMLSHNR